MSIFGFPQESRAKRVTRALVAAAMTAVGVLHFTSPDGFLKIMPPWVPAPLVMVYVSGFFEIAGGVGLLVPKVRVAAAWGLVALYVAVFPANVHMAMHKISPLGKPIPDVVQWGRLPLQAVFIAVAIWLARDARADAKR